MSDHVGLLSSSSVEIVNSTSLTNLFLSRDIHSVLSLSPSMSLCIFFCISLYLSLTVCLYLGPSIRHAKWTGTQIQRTGFDVLRSPWSRWIVYGSQGSSLNCSCPILHQSLCPSLALSALIVSDLLLQVELFKYRCKTIVIFLGLSS